MCSDLGGITQYYAASLILLSFLCEMKPQGTRRWQYLDQDTNFCFSILCTSLLWVSLILSGKYSNHICLTLLPVSFKHHGWLSQPPVILLKAIRFTFSLFWLKHILAKQRTSHFAILTPCADCPALVLKTLKGLPKTKFTTVRHDFLHLGLLQWNPEPDHECFKGNMKLGYGWWLVYGCLIVFLI